ncbi:hypothetical protein SGRA_3158 [Saprospira grandis str. Lewin]|uniref:Uncharacterized protein n=1 Tax=Saprospira grandis (strain Lewin) TaxID=984262 RepID=H6L0T0_SAPGL|nr:hypothetical protein SGRA_3158 [Saprospira grandis str. Lewin]
MARASFCYIFLVSFFKRTQYFLDKAQNLSFGPFSRAELLALK